MVGGSSYTIKVLCCVGRGLELYSWLCHMLPVHHKQTRMFPDMALTLVFLMAEPDLSNTLCLLMCCQQGQNKKERSTDA